MSSPSDHERLLHMKEAVDLVVEYTQHLDLIGFRLDRKSQLSIDELNRFCTICGPKPEGTHKGMPLRLSEAYGLFS
jgi:hypothetical protein